MFRSWVFDHLTRPAIFVEQESISYEKLSLQIENLALQFLKKGICNKHRVAFIATTHVHSLLIFFALLEIGASPCPLSSRLPLKQIPIHLKQARASFFINSNFTVEKCAIETCFIQNTTILLFTSGSSGAPKLVSLKKEHFLASAEGSIEKLGLNQVKGCWLLSVPLFHVSGLSILFRCFSSGSSVAFSSNFLTGHPFASHISLVPTQLMRYLSKEIYFPRLTCALLGGAPLSETLIQMALVKKIPLYLTYGMTELASQITMTSLSDLLLPIHLGKPLPGKEVNFSMEGEILVKGSSLFTGYDSMLGVQKKLLEDGWFPTGDLGKWNQEGNLEYKGRKDNLFISGGENIYPETIEEAIRSIPGVLQSLVVPLADQEFGHRPVAFVQTQNDTLPSKEEFHEKLSSLLPKFCLPVHFFPFPVQEGEKSFKIKRSELKTWLKQSFLK